MLFLLLALGGAMLIEGTVYALFPDAMKRAMSQIMNLPENQLRNGGLVIAGIGFLLLVLVLPRM